MIMALTFVILVALLLFGVPVPFSFAGTTIFLIAVFGFDPSALFATSYTQLSSVTLLAIPLFIIAGGVMEKGRIGEALIGWVNVFVGRSKAALTWVTCIASAIFGSICGSGAATLSCIGSIVAPQMRAKKYPISVAAACACCAAPLGLLIPPSAMQILVAWTLNISVLACFLSTVVPGIILTILLGIVSKLLLRNNTEIETDQKVSGSEWIGMFGKKTKTALPALIMPVIILGGIYSGIMTATESAGIAVIYAIPVAMFIYKKMDLRGLGSTLRESAVSTGVIMCMIGIVMMMSRVLTQVGLPQAICNGLLSVSDNKYVILIMLNVFLVILGMIMDDTSATLLAAPILFPVIQQIGVSPYQFAAILGVNIGMGNITPPSAPFLYLSGRIFNIDAAKIMKPVLWMILGGYLPTLLLTTFIPEVSLTLPKLILGAKLGF
jgi:C4-dicarboxylate transporter DctM subunit